MKCSDAPPPQGIDSGAPYDVAVIGAGPGGSVTAQRIAAAGWRVILFEKSEYPGKDAVCGGMVGGEDVELFGIDPALVEKKLFRCLCHFAWGSIDLHLRQPVKSTVLTVQRKNLDRFLAEEAVRSGAELRVRSRVVRVRRIATGEVAVRFRHEDDEQEVLARLVVFADGPLTLAHRSFGIGYHGGDGEVACAVICDFEFPKNTVDYFEGFFVREAGATSFGWMFPFADHVNFGMAFLRSEMRKNRRVLQDLLDFMLRRYEPSSRLTKGRRLLRKRGALIPMKLAKRFHGDSCLVVGDAAGFVAAMTGVGITYAMHSGLYAAETAIEALDKRDFSEAFLARYPRRWRRSRKYRKLWVMDVLRRGFLLIHRVDPQFMNKVNFFLNIQFFKAQGKGLGFLDGIRVLFYPLLGRPDLRLVRVSKPRKGAASGNLVKSG